MALPLIPLLFGAAALLVLSKKKSAPPPDGEPDYQPGSGGVGGSSVPPGPSGGLGGRVINRITAVPGRAPIDVWGQCPAPSGSPVGTYAALGHKGECVVFWKPDTWAVMRDFLGAEFMKLSKAKRKSICNLDECIPNPYAKYESDLYCEWRPNPQREAFISNAIKKAFSQLSQESFPPNRDTKHFPKMVWTFTSNLFSSEFCGIGRVT